MIMGIFKILKTKEPKNMKYRKPYREMKKILMWGSFLVLFMEGYIEILISSYLNILSTIFYTGSDNFSFYAACAILVIQVIVLPCAFLYMLTRPEEFLKSKEPKLRMGVLYSDIKTNSKLALAYNFLQVLRRLILVLVAFGPLIDLPATI